MSKPGIGARLHMLGGGSAKSSKDYEGRLIKHAELVANALHLTFEDDITIRIRDDAQSCCESRYMDTDDDIKKLEGKVLGHIMDKPGPDNEDQFGEVHEIVFVEIMTTDGSVVTLVNHNEHNGYYGGFGLSIDEIS